MFNSKWMKMLLAAILFLVIGLAGHYLLRPIDKPGEDRPVHRPDLPARQVEHFTLHLPRLMGGGYEWRIEGEELIEESAHEMVVLLNIQGKAYLDDEVWVDFSGPWGQVDMQENFIFVAGPAVLRSRELNIKAGSLEWLQEERIIWGKEGVEVEGEGFTATARQMELKDDFSSMLLSGDVRVRVEKNTADEEDDFFP